MLQKRGTVRQSCSGRVGALVMFAFSLSCQILLMFEAHWPILMKAFPLKHVLGWGGRLEEVGGGDLTLNSPLRTWLSLKHPLSCRAFKPPECVANSRVSF